MSLGTRCHQLAMYVVFESPLQMLADSPTNYLREPEMMEFLRAVPTVWDETRVLDARIGDYVVVARRKGQRLVRRRDDRLDAARAGRSTSSFLGDGRFQMTSLRGRSGRRPPTPATTARARPRRPATRLKIKLAPGGGFAARIRP